MNALPTIINSLTNVSPKCTPLLFFSFLDVLRPFPRPCCNFSPLKRRYIEIRKSNSFIHSFKKRSKKKSVLVFVIKSPFFLSSASMLSPHIISLFLPLHLVTHLERPLNMSTHPHHRDSPSERLIFLPPTTGGLSY